MVAAHSEDGGMDLASGLQLGIGDHRVDGPEGLLDVDDGTGAYAFGLLLAQGVDHEGPFPVDGSDHGPRPARPYIKSHHYPVTSHLSPHPF